MWILISLLDQEITDAYGLQDLIVQGRVLVETKRACMVSPQAGRSRL
jgi:hypothetical protein